MRANRTAADAKFSSSVPAGKFSCAPVRRKNRRERRLPSVQICLNARAATAKIAHQLRTLEIAVLTLLAGIVFAAAEPPELQQLRSQLKTAQNANDKPAIIELSRRVVAIAPNDSDTWDTLAQTQLEIEDLDDLERTLDGWQKAFRRPPAAIEDFRAGLCFKREDYQCAPCVSHLSSSTRVPLPSNRIRNLAKPNGDAQRRAERVRCSVELDPRAVPYGASSSRTTCRTTSRVDRPWTCSSSASLIRVW